MTAIRLLLLADLDVKDAGQFTPRDSACAGVVNPSISTIGSSCLIINSELVLVSNPVASVGVSFRGRSDANNRAKKDPSRWGI